jgi:23S rRNA A2030 N6-methylase RlmJ
LSERYVHDQKAGNFHDVWKHFILAEYIKMCADLSPLTYIDTHAGSLAYKNNSLDQLVTGIMKFPNNFNDIPPSTYSQLLKFYGARYEIEKRTGEHVLLYPGSLAVASYCMLQSEGHIIGCEINEAVFQKCKRNMEVFKRVSRTPLAFKCLQTDGYKYAKNYIKVSKAERGIVFVDPPYYPNEGDDWGECLDLLSNFKDSTNWSYVLWYCIYTDNLNSNMGYFGEFKDQVLNHKFKAIDIQLQVNPLTATYAKSVTGIYIVNPIIKGHDFIARLHTIGLGKIASLLKNTNDSWGPKIHIDMVGDLY